MQSRHQQSFISLYVSSIDIMRARQCHVLLLHPYLHKTAAAFNPGQQFLMA